ncbi:hypothetical protein M8C21_006144 [Ambrosia artemisiifolia]|uniref:Uncharacterized protein n=1 Tax=Ambrosia artemisiifolia TaxID=4212 RepID=A0AAD5CUU2_AMBAR|nr:hypothetical protein M8C21_006144 [Ambrosia artemisiifolia]
MLPEISFYMRRLPAFHNLLDTTRLQMNKLTSNRGGTFMEQMTLPRLMRSILRPDMISGSKIAKGMESISFDDAPELFFSNLVLLHAYFLHAIDMMKLHQVISFNF